MSETGSSDSNAQLDQVLNVQPEVSAQIGACSTSQCRKPKAQTKWPSDIIKVAGFDSEGFPTNDDGMKRWRLICGLIARQRVGINVHFEDLDEPAWQGLFLRAHPRQSGIVSEGWHANQSPSSTGASSPVWYEILSMKVQSPSSCTNTWIVKTGRCS